MIWLASSECLRYGDELHKPDNGDLAIGGARENFGVRENDGAVYLFKETGLDRIDAGNDEIRASTFGDATREPVDKPLEAL